MPVVAVGTPSARCHARDPKQFPWDKRLYMEDRNTGVRGPGARPWIVGIVLLALVAALAFWLLDERADDRALDGMSSRAGAPAALS